jgi:hypothetical protein
MRRLVIALALLLVACSQANGKPAAAVVTPTKPVTSSTPSGKGLPSPTPTSTIDLPLATVAFSCRLPIYTDGSVIEDSFITFPDGGISPTPVGTGGMYFDRAYSRWLPVPRREVSPDSAGFAYVDYNGTDFILHVITVASGKEVQIPLTNQAFNGEPDVLDYSADGIYLENGFEHLLAGLWLVNPSTGAMRQLSKDVYPVFSAGNGIIWVQTVNPADPFPVITASSVGTLPDEIDRVDLKTGTNEEWLYMPGKGLSLMGLDSRGLPLIETALWGADANARMWLVAAPDSPTSIYKGGLVQSLSGGIADSHGVWFGSRNGIYLYTNPGYLVKVSDQPGYPANGCF